MLKGHDGGVLSMTLAPAPSEPGQPPSLSLVTSGAGLGIQTALLAYELRSWHMNCTLGIRTYSWLTKCTLGLRTTLHAYMGIHVATNEELSRSRHTRTLACDFITYSMELQTRSLNSRSGQIAHSVESILRGGETGLLIRSSIVFDKPHKTSSLRSGRQEGHPVI